MAIEIVTEMTATAEMPKPAPGTPEFSKLLFKEFRKEKAWRSVRSLSKSLEVESGVLSEFLDSNQSFVRRPGKEGTYYALSERISEFKPVKDEDNYALAMLHMIHLQFFKVLKTYGLEISRMNSESFVDFVSSLDKLEAGLLSFSSKMRVRTDRLPKVND